MIWKVYRLLLGIWFLNVLLYKPWVIYVNSILVKIGLYLFLFYLKFYLCVYFSCAGSLLLHVGLL